MEPRKTVEKILLELYRDLTFRANCDSIELLRSGLKVHTIS
jgi:hypothetical protein